VAGRTTAAQVTHLEQQKQSSTCRAGAMGPCLRWLDLQGHTGRRSRASGLLIQRAETGMGQINDRPDEQHPCSEASKRAKMSRPHETTRSTGACPCALP
jgi:hypothetical protein